MNEMINNTSFDGVWSLVKSSEVVIGDSDTRVSPVKNKHSIFVTKTDIMVDISADGEESLFEK
jgi:hypothetical protein